jgi:hypothetical protein
LVNASNFCGFAKHAVLKSKAMRVQKKDARKIAEEWEKAMIQGIFETLFDVCYLTVVTLLGILMIKNHRKNKQYLLFGVMAVTLGAGDAFHLVPRAYALLTTGLENHTAALGTGKFITSITMTVFYVLLYHVWRERYQVKNQLGLSAAVYGLAMVRIALCLFPQNAWTSPAPPLSWAILRNIPFAALGVITILLFYRSAREREDTAFRWMWLTIVLSFAFYIPVVLFADAFPLVGILMIPKTIAYVWTVVIGYRDMIETQKEQNHEKAD